MYFKEFVKTKWLESAYIFICAIFLFNLQKLNIILLEENLNDRPFDLIVFNRCKPLIYFFATVFLFLIGAALIVHNSRLIMHSELSLEGIAFAIISIIIIAAAMFFLIKFINNPILQAVLVVLTAGGGILLSEL